MELLKNTFIALFPLYFYMALGAALRRMKVLKTEDLPRLNGLLFRSFIFFSVFNNLRGADFSRMGGGKLMLFGALSVFLVFLVCMLIVPRFLKDYGQSTAAIQAMVRSNFVLLGMAYAEQLCGADNLGPVSLLMSAVTPMMNLTGVLIFELLRGGRVHVGRLLASIFKNPLIIAAILGIACSLLRVSFPEYLDKPIRSLGSVATPFAMVLVGASLTLQSMAKNRKLVLIVSAVRLLIVPIVIVPVAVLMGFRGAALVGIMTAFAAPTAVVTVAQSYDLGGDGELAAEIVATTSLISLLTMFLWVLALRGMGLC